MLLPAPLLLQTLLLLLLLVNGMPTHRGLRLLLRDLGP